MAFGWLSGALAASPVAPSTSGERAWPGGASTPDRELISYNPALLPLGILSELSSVTDRAPLPEAPFVMDPAPAPAATTETPTILTNE